MIQRRSPLAEGASLDLLPAARAQAAAPGRIRIGFQKRPRSPVAPLYAAIVAAPQRVADAFARLGPIPSR